MKKLLALVMVLFLPLTALADAPPAFAPALFGASPADFAQACEAALADTTLAGSAVAEKDGMPILDWSEYNAFAAMYRPDGLLMLCHFVPDGEGVRLVWHNDLLLSPEQELALTLQGAVWSGGSLPTLRMMESFKFTMCIDRQDGTRLNLVADFDAGGWRVTELMLAVQHPDGRWHPALRLPEDCLADDIYLATCMPNDWRRGETEEENQYGW